MANKKSSEKDIRRTEKRRKVNLLVVSKLKTLRKNFLKVKDDSSFNVLQKYAQSIARKGHIHKNKASRMISRAHILLKTTSQTVVA